MIIKPKMKVIQGRIEVPEFSWRGRKFPAHSFSYDIENLGTNKPAYALGSDSLTLGYQAALFEIALLSQLSKDTGVSDEVKEAALEHYNVITSDKNKGKGNWNKTAIDYGTDFGKPSPWLPEGYERIGIIEFLGWENKNGVLVPEGEPVAVDVPKPDFAALTKDGLYNAYGIAFETTNRKEAKKRLKELALQFGKDKNFAENFAEKNVSYFQRRSQRRGYSFVSRSSGISVSGPFYVGAYWLAGDFNNSLGSFPSRSSDKK